ncbi:MAG: peptidylprolyl isomerase [Candidatus Margulisbacteria bacterium]|nr:peptidylprolyl isomerase [Candidatus Margulisiibacteriota bacterium]MBU1022593.1 peptidylprolyl isomerase [Candidatus Margulisiibacteriota bacterium]MBU1728879.1 peptidylprolyl isomerase [Candidatus Margulisiibacteriota bacterium]MBU1955510.1 peptidylprolyl isomerase [Candidatus Margulisiibacteriota bacterium]
MLQFFRKKMKVIIISVAVVFVASIFYGLGMSSLGGGGTQRSNAIATVNGKAVDPVRFNQILGRLTNNFSRDMSPQELLYFQSLALDQTIDFSIMLNEAKRKVGVSGGEIDQALQSVMKSSNIKSMDELNAALKKSGSDMGTLRNVIKEEILVQKMVNQIKGDVKITSDDLREVSARHILIRAKPSLASTEAERKAQNETADINAKKLAEEISARIKKGESFSRLAGKYSDDPGSATKGGDLGYFTKGMMVPEFDAAVFSLKVGDVSDIVKTAFGYHIIKLEDSRLRKFKDKDKDVQVAALEEKQEREFLKWFSEIKNKAKVQINDPLMQGFRLRMQGRINEAITYFLQAISENPTNPYLHLLLGDTYAAMGQADLQLMEYKKAVELNPGDASLHILLAKLYEERAKDKDQTKNINLAIEEYKKASIVSGENKAVRQMLADKFKELGQWQLSAKELSEIKRIEKKEAFEEEMREKAKANETLN